MNFSYIKFIESGHKNDTLIYVGKDEPTDYICKIMGLRKAEESEVWVTDLGKVDANKAELAFVAPFKEEVVGRFTTIINTYIFKVENEPDAYIE